MPKLTGDRLEVQIARRKLLLDDQVYQDILSLHFDGATSSKDLSQAQVKQLLEIFVARGYRRPAGKNGRPGKRQASGNYRKIPTGPFSAMQRKVCALWVELGYDLKKLDARVKKQFGPDRIEWLRDYEQLHVLITDLEKRARKKAGG